MCRVDLPRRHQRVWSSLCGPASLPRQATARQILNLGGTFPPSTLRIKVTLDQVGFQTCRSCGENRMIRSPGVSADASPSWKTGNKGPANHWKVGALDGRSHRSHSQLSRAPRLHALGGIVCTLHASAWHRGSWRALDVGAMYGFTMPAVSPSQAVWQASYSRSSRVGSVHQGRDTRHTQTYLPTVNCTHVVSSGFVRVFDPLPPAIVCSLAAPRYFKYLSTT